jgi:methylmalonyl-CoA mutase
VLERLLQAIFLYKAGVAAIFGPGTPVAYSAKVVMQLLMQE